MQTSKRNKDNAIQTILSISNRQGFIQQSEQFENRSVASDDTSNYKIVERNSFAFNPARINVGSIARLATFDRGIVSPEKEISFVKEGTPHDNSPIFFFSQITQKNRTHSIPQRH